MFKTKQQVFTDRTELFSQIKSLLFIICLDDDDDYYFVVKFN